MSHDFLFMVLPRKMAVLGSLMLALLFVTETSFAETQKRRYDVQIDGMVCAFCAYNVSKRLANVEGVIRGSVRVALETKQVRFDARAELPKSLIEQALADSGFTVQAINWKVHDGNEGAAPYDQLAAKIALPVATLGSTLTEQLLDTLGTAAAGHGRLVIQAPAHQETALLKPLLAGRRAAILVEFQATKTDTVSVALWTRLPASGASHE